MAKKTVADAAKAKAAKQKKIVIALGCVLALAVAYAAKTMMSLNSGGGQKPQAVSSVAVSPSTTPAVTTPSSAAPAPPTLAGSQGTTSYTGGSSGTTTTAADGVDPARRRGPAAGRHGAAPVVLALRDQGPVRLPGAEAGWLHRLQSGSSGSGGSGGTTTTPATPPAPPAPPPTSAVISVNGVQESVSTGADFPAASPFFQLVSLTATTAQVAIAGGSYASGQATLALQVNKAVTLVNTADGTRYTLLLLPQGAAAPAAAAGSSSSVPTTTTTSTTPTTPTTTTP